jgi:hypothetical protein
MDTHHSSSTADVRITFGLREDDESPTTRWSTEGANQKNAILGIF